MKRMVDDIKDNVTVITVTTIAMEEFAKRGYSFKNSDETVAFCNREGKKLFEMVADYETGFPIVITEKGCYFIPPLLFIK